jgi:hypothetical protein
MKINSPNNNKMFDSAGDKKITDRILNPKTTPKIPMKYYLMFGIAITVSLMQVPVNSDYMWNAIFFVIRVGFMTGMYVVLDKTKMLTKMNQSLADNEKPIAKFFYFMSAAIPMAWFCMWIQALDPGIFFVMWIPLVFSWMVSAYLKITVLPMMPQMPEDNRKNKRK